jgi:hypothetical protein
MLKPLSQYIRDESLPRWRVICLTPEAFLSWLVLVSFLLYGNKYFNNSPKISDITTGLIAYSAIALGFCVAGLTISLTLPDRNFAVRMAKTIPSGKLSSYSDLLFVFSWTAVVHWVALMCLFAVVLFADSSQPLLPPRHQTVRLWVAAGITAICFYCLCQFLITLITLSQVGAVYIRFLSQESSK